MKGIFHDREDAVLITISDMLRGNVYVNLQIAGIVPPTAMLRSKV